MYYTVKAIGRVLHCNETFETFENTPEMKKTLACGSYVFSTFRSCSQMPLVFYHSVIHGLGFFIC